MVTTGRSAMSEPDEERPGIIARLIICAEREGSLDTATVWPFGYMAPIAAPSRAVNSGVNSTLVSPVIPKEVKRPRFQEPAQITESVTTAPASTCLSGQILTLACTTAPAPITTSLPITLPSSSSEPFFTVAARQTIAPRRRQFSPMYAWSQVTELETLVPTSTVVYAPMTQASLSHAPGRTRAPAPTKALPSMRASDETSASSAIQTPSLACTAGMSMSTLP